MAAGTDLGDAPNPARIIELTRAKLEGDSDPPWQTLEGFLSGEMTMDMDSMRDLYGALLVILERVIDYVDRMPS